MASGCGQVAQVVERSPEKAGVGGSTPSLATTSFNWLGIRHSQRTRALFGLRYGYPLVQVLGAGNNPQDIQLRLNHYDLIGR